MIPGLSNADVGSVVEFDSGEIAGMRSAAWILLATAAINVLVWLLQRNGLPPFTSLIDAFLGVQLLHLKHSWRAWALVRAGFGGALVLVVIAIALMASSPLVAVLAIGVGQFAYCASLFLLLLGRPSIGRVVAGRVVFGVAVVLYLVGAVLVAVERVRV